MKIETDNLYHVYNRGNLKQKVFLEDGNYLFFLEKVRKLLVPITDILAWTLMPNHYHFLIYANEVSAALIEGRHIPITQFSESMRLLQSGYTKAINSDLNIRGNLFHQKYKAKRISRESPTYGANVFHYIHGNAAKAGLVENMIDWPFSSYREYMRPHIPGLCNKYLAMELLDLDFHSISLGV